MTHRLSPWLRKAPPRGGVKVGVGWYSEAEWSKVKAAASDPERFEATYSEWVHVAETALANLRAAGIPAEKFDVVSAELLAWCLASGVPNDGASRARFVSERLGRKGGRSR